MTQTIVTVVLFLIVIGLLPVGVRWYLQRSPRGSLLTLSSRVLSSAAVGPHQRVVTVEVGPEGEKVVLVLGVTAQQVNCLHVFPPSAKALPPADIPGDASPVFTVPHASADATGDRT